MDFSNQATLKFNDKINTSNIVKGIINRSITINKSSRTADYSPGSEIYYTVTINNDDNISYENMTLTDDLGRYLWNGLTRFSLEYVPRSAKLIVSNSRGFSQNEITGTVNDNGLNFTFDIRADTILILSYIAKPTIFASFDKGASIRNFATLTKLREGTSFYPISSDYTIRCANYTDVRVIKTIDKDKVMLDQPITYTLNILNYGNIADVPKISDIIYPYLPDIKVYGNGKLWTEDVQYKYERETGLLTVNENVFTVDAATFTTGPIGSSQTVPSSYQIKVTGIVQGLTPEYPYINIVPAYTDERVDNISIFKKSYDSFEIRSSKNKEENVTFEIITQPECKLEIFINSKNAFKLNDRLLSFIVTPWDLRMPDICVIRVESSTISSSIKIYTYI